MAEMISNSFQFYKLDTLLLSLAIVTYFLLLLLNSILPANVSYLSILVLIDILAASRFSLYLH